MPDGGDHSCDPGDPCTSDAAKWVRLCDRNADLDRDFHATLTSLSEWEDLFWTPSDSTKALAEEHYPDTGAGKPYQRFFVPMCEDGSNTTKGETACADGKPIIQCTDGTRPVFYYDPGTTDKWIIHIQSGDITCSTSSRGQNCWQLDEEQGRENLAHFSTAWAENDDTIAVKGLMRSSNSPFADYNRVFIDKCVGDRNRGDKTVQNYPFVAKDGTSVDQGTVYFHGFRILKALLPLLNQGGAGNGIANASQISFAANSNGSNGLYMYLDHLADFIHSSGAYKKSGLDLPDIDVRGLTSSYVTSSVETENLINNRRKNIFSWRAYNFTDFDDHISAPESAGEFEADGFWYSTLTYYDGVEFERSRDWGTIDFGSSPPTNVRHVEGAKTIDESLLS